MIRTTDPATAGENRIAVGITHGDINSISYEVIIKACADQRITELYTPIVYGTSKAASYHRKMLNIPDFSFNIIRSADQASPKKANLVNLSEKEVKIDIGESTVAAGELALLSINAAVKKKKIRRHKRIWKAIENWRLGNLDINLTGYLLTQEDRYYVTVPRITYFPAISVR